MLIVGAGGFAKEIFEIFHHHKDLNKIAFYDDVNTFQDDKIYGRFNLIQNLEEAKKYFKHNGYNFVLGLGNPYLRYKLYCKFTKIGGVLTSTISDSSIIGHYNVDIGVGSNVLPASIFSNDVTLGKACIVYYNAVITHDCKIGDFVEISPSVNILGRVVVGNFCQLGAGSIILPDIKIGNNVVVGAGALVNKDIQDNSLVVGVPAKIIRKLEPLIY